MGAEVLDGQGCDYRPVINCVCACGSRPRAARTAGRRGRITTVLVAILTSLSSTALPAVPTGFQETVVATGLAQPAALAVAPDGRIAVGERAAGRVRLIKNGSVLATPLVDVKQAIAAPQYLEAYSERGLLGLAFDPQFPAQPYLYAYYTVCKVPGAGYCQTAKNRVVRFTVGQGGNPDVASPGSQVVLLDDIDSDAGNHNAGWLGFSPVDGKLYVSVGDGGANAAKAQQVGSLNGKVLRLERSGAVPFDNPYVGLFGARPEIWAVGLRNPWRCRFAPDGRLFCADVGAGAWEEVNWIVAGGNYGWPTTEGTFSGSAYPQFVRPIYTYPHYANRADETFYGASITGGDFGAKTTFPGDYQQSYFFGDYGNKWIHRVVLAADGVTVLSRQVFGQFLNAGVVDLVAGADGALYYTDFEGGRVLRIGSTSANRPPVARLTATPTQGAAPLLVQVGAGGSTDPDGDALTYTWAWGDGTANGTGASASHTYPTRGVYELRLTVTDGRGGTDTATTTITVGTPPVVTISAPTGTPFVGGQTIALAGGATDLEDGVLPASALRWEVRFHHADHWHPYVAELVGTPQSFVTATTGETAADVWYRVYLRATDSAGLTGEAYVDVPPTTVWLTVATQPAGLRVTLDGQPQTAPVTVAGVVGVVRTLGVSSPQGGYTFAGWSDGGVQVHTITTPAANTTYTATFSGSTPSTTVVPPPTTTSSTAAIPTTSTTVVPTTTTTSTTVAGGTLWFGSRTIGTQASGNTADNKRMSPFTLSEAGAVSRLVVYLSSATGGSQRVRPVIYRDASGAPGTLAAAGPEQVVTAPGSGGWIGLPFTSPVALTAGRYWLGIISGENGGATIHYFGTTSWMRAFAWDPYADGPSSPAGSATLTQGPMSIYAEYTPTVVTTTSSTSTTTTTELPPTTTTTVPPTTTTTVLPTTTTTVLPTTTTTVLPTTTTTVLPTTTTTVLPTTTTTVPPTTTTTEPPPPTTTTTTAPPPTTTTTVLPTTTTTVPPTTTTTEPPPPTTTTTTAPPPTTTTTTAPPPTTTTTEPLPPTTTTTEPPPPTTTTTAPPSTTTTTTAPPPMTTTTTEPPLPTTTTTTEPSPTTTTTTLPPKKCRGKGTRQSLLCRSQELAAQLSVLQGAGELVPNRVTRDLWATSARMKRSVTECEAGNTRKARALLRAAERRAARAGAVLRQRWAQVGSAAVGVTLTSDGLDELVDELRSLRSEMPCP